MNPPNIIDQYPAPLWHLLMDWWTLGYTEGIEHGRQQMDEELATVQRRAAGIVHAMAKLAPRDLEADRAAAERREARWSA